MFEPADYFSNHHLKLRFPWKLYHRPIVNSLIEVLHQKPGARVLNVGSGPFLELEHLPKRPWRYTLCDIDPRAIELARKLYGEQLEGGDVLKAGDPLPYPDDSFDLVVSMDVIEHLVAPGPWVKDLVRVVKPGGWLFFTTPNYESLSLRALEMTVLEWIARGQGFSRRHLHPSKFTRALLRTTLQNAGAADVQIQRISLGWVLAARATKPLSRSMR